MHIVLTGNTTFKLANFRQGLIRELIRGGYRVTVLAPPDDYVPVVRDLGCDHVPLAMDRNGTSVTAEAKLLLAITRRLHELRPQAVLSYTIKNNIYGGLAARLLGIPFIPNVTGLGPAFNKPGMLNTVVRLLYRVAFGRARTVFFQNDSDLGVFTRAGLCPPSRARLLPGSGVDLEQFRARALPEEANCIRFLLVSRMLWDKGVGVFVEAARTVRRRHPDARFQLLGPLDPDSRTGVGRDQIDDWVAEGIVEYLGTARDVRPFLEAAHCVVLPSHYREGTPRSLLEACASGRPIVTTNMPGCRDVVAPGLSGFLVPPADAEALADAFTQFIALTPEKRAAMGLASRRVAEERFDERIVIDAYAKILRELP